MTSSYVLKTFLRRITKAFLKLPYKETGQVNDMFPLPRSPLSEIPGSIFHKHSKAIYFLVNKGLSTTYCAYLPGYN